MWAQYNFSGPWEKISVLRQYLFFLQFKQTLPNLPNLASPSLTLLVTLLL